MAAMFVNEQELVDVFLSYSVQIEESLAPSANISTEFDYARGRTDLIMLSQNGEVIALEAKLSKWRVALQQAFRNTCFSDRSYVVLPLDVATRAAQYTTDFDNFGVGICGVSRGGMKVLRHAPKHEPIQPTLKAKAIEQITEQVSDAATS